MAVRRRQVYGHCTTLDMHSFPLRSLPYELDRSRDRPEICIGSDEFHTPEPLTDDFVKRFSAEGLSVAVNRPSSGAMVPMRYYRKDRRVASVMVEVNRRLYLDNATSKRG